jgi:hypothetical protein
MPNWESVTKTHVEKTVMGREKMEETDPVKRVR